MLFQTHFSSYQIIIFVHFILIPPLFPGNIWEEMREDVLVSDPQVSTTTLCGSSVLPDPRSHNSSNLVVRQTSEETTVSACKTEKEDEDAVCGQNLAEDGCVNGLHPVAYSGVENIAGYLTSCTTFISLM